MKIYLPTCALFAATVFPIFAQHALPALNSTASQIAQGKLVFETNCSVGYCHGLQGKAGKGPRLRDRVWSKSYLYRTINKGIANSSMPGWEGRITNQSIDAVVSYILSISQEEMTPGIKEQKGPLLSIQSLTAKDAALGKQLFFDPTKDRNCGVCHRLAGSGTAVALDMPKVSDLADKALLKQVVEQPDCRRLAHVRLKDGETIYGVKADETADTVRIYDFAGAGPPVLRTVERSYIALQEPYTDLQVHETNLHQYTPEELASVAAFLKSLQ